MKRHVRQYSRSPTKRCGLNLNAKARPRSRLVLRPLKSVLDAVSSPWRALSQDDSGGWGMFDGTEEISA